MSSAAGHHVVGSSSSRRRWLVLVVGTVVAGRLALVLVRDLLGLLVLGGLRFAACCSIGCDTAHLGKVNLYIYIYMYCSLSLSLYIYIYI